MSGIHTILFAFTAVWAGVATLEAWRGRALCSARTAKDQTTIDELREELLEHSATLKSMSADHQNLTEMYRQACDNIESGLATIADKDKALSALAAERDRLTSALAAANAAEEFATKECHHLASELAKVSGNTASKSKRKKS